MLFTGQYEAGGDFTDEGLGGVVRFLDRVWRLVDRHAANAPKHTPTGEPLRRMHETIQRVTDDISSLKYNTAIAALMSYLNWLESPTDSPSSPSSVNSLSAIRNTTPAPSRPELRTLLTSLAPFAPFVTEELWSRMGEPHTIHQSTWPEVDQAALTASTATLIVQVDGRVRDRLTIAADLPEAEIESAVRALDNIQRHLTGKRVARIVHVAANATRLVNIVTDSAS